MLITVETPPQLPDILQCSPADFRHQAKMAMATKLYEMGKISSGMAAQLAGIGRVEFLLQLSRYGVTMIDLDEEELNADFKNA
jgi:predicted HTH domain antitoxin